MSNPGAQLQIKRFCGIAVVSGLLPGLVVWWWRRRRRNERKQEVSVADQSGGHLLEHAFFIVESTDECEKTVNSTADVVDEVSQAANAIPPSSCGRCKAHFSVWRFRRICVLCRAHVCSHCSIVSSEDAATTCHRCSCPKRTVGSSSDAEEEKAYGVLCIDVIEAVGVLAADQNMLGQLTSSDPFCMVTLNQWPQNRPDLQVPGVKTRSIKQTLNPRWAERLIFAVNASNPRVHVEIWDEDRFSANDPMGSVDLELSTVLPFSRGAEVTSWFKISPPQSLASAEPCGALLLRLCWEELDSQKLFLALAHPEPLPPPPFDLDSIYVPVMQIVSRLTKGLESEGHRLRQIKCIFGWASPIQSISAIIVWVVLTQWLQFWPCIFFLLVAADMVVNRCLDRPKPTSAHFEEDKVDEKHLAQGIMFLSRALPPHIKEICQQVQAVVCSVNEQLHSVAVIVRFEHEGSATPLGVAIVLAFFFSYVSLGTLLGVGGALAMILQAPWVHGILAYASWFRAHRSRAFTPIMDPPEAWFSAQYLKQQARPTANSNPTQAEA